MKPSELCQATNQLIADLVPQYLDPDLYRVVNGDVPVTTKVLSHSHVRLAHLFTRFLNLQLLELRWDHSEFRPLSLYGTRLTDSSLDSSLHRYVSSY